MEEVPATPFRPEVVSRVLKHMNDDHELSLLAYCRAFRGDFRAESAEILSLDSGGFRVKACAGDYCQAHTFKFPCKLSSPVQLRKAFIELHHQSLSPPATQAWPFPVPVVAVTFLLQWALLPLLAFGGIEDIFPHLSESLNLGLGLPEVAALVFYASIIAHVGEQFFAVWKCYKVKAGTRNQVLWAALVFLLGFPALQGLLALTAPPTSCSRREGKDD